MTGIILDAWPRYVGTDEPAEIGDVVRGYTCDGYVAEGRLLRLRFEIDADELIDSSVIVEQDGYEEVIDADEIYLVMKGA